MKQRNSLVMALLMAVGGSSIGQTSRVQPSIQEAWRELSCAALADLATDWELNKAIVGSRLPKATAVAKYFNENGGYTAADVAPLGPVMVHLLTRSRGYNLDFVVGRYYDYAHEHWMYELEKRGPNVPGQLPHTYAAYREMGCVPFHGQLDPNNRGRARP